MKNLLAWITAFLMLLSGSIAMAQETAPAVPAAPPVDPANILSLELSTGGIVEIALRPDKAPRHVERIRTLANRGFYNGLIFHRVIPGFMAQSGDPTGTGTGGSDLPDLKQEFNDLPHFRGTFSMARADSEDSANSQFFIMLAANFRLDGKYTAMGRVISGMKYVDALPAGEPPANPAKIVRAWMLPVPVPENPVAAPAVAPTAEPDAKGTAPVADAAGDRAPAAPAATPDAPAVPTPESPPSPAPAPAQEPVAEPVLPYADVSQPQ